MQKAIHYCLILCICMLFGGCVSSPDSLTDSNKQEYRFEYADIENVSLQTLNDGSKITKLDLSVGDKTFSCYGRLSSELNKILSEKKVLHKIELKRLESGALLIESIQTSMGLYGSLQYWLAHSWLSNITPYEVAHTISLIIPVIVFILIMLVGFIFVEF